MEKLLQVKEVDRYFLRQREPLENVEEILNIIINENYSLFYNNNNTGETFQKNFLSAKEVRLEKLKDIIEIMKKEEHNFYGVISFYKENGYYGIRIVTDEEALIKRPNNWIERGQNGFIYLITAEKEVTISKFENYLSHYMNFGAEEITVMDRMYDEMNDYFLYMGNDEELEEFKKGCEKEYGLTKEHFKKQINI